MPGKCENIVKLNADHDGVCKFGTCQEDEDNLELVQGNVRDLYENALRIGELHAVPNLARDETVASDPLQARLAELRGDISKYWI
jgi:hypothetical protein